MMPLKTDASKKAKSNVLKPGDRIRDTYAVEKYIGRGHFGEVYRVRHPYLGKQVMKVITNEKVCKNGFEQRKIAHAIQSSRGSCWLP